jgi:Resolvase, N terminal domain/Reverse transcriptase (RNA-dependent DNA polymerase)
MKTAAIYARVSSDKQREENTIASQTAALVTFAREQQFDVPQEWVFEDDGYSGASLIRPGVIFCVRGAISPILANLFLHYAFDTWMKRTFPHIPFERYADDAICHCKSAEEAQALWSALADRFAGARATLISLLSLAHAKTTKTHLCS